jgi:hypothetical protein
VFSFLPSVSLFGEIPWPQDINFCKRPILFLHYLDSFYFIFTFCTSRPCNFTLQTTSPLSYSGTGKRSTIVVVVEGENCCLKADNQKNFKLALKKFVYTYYFYIMEEYLTHLWIMYYITRFLIIVVHWFKILSMGIQLVLMDYF